MLLTAQIKEYVHSLDALKEYLHSNPDAFKYVDNDERTLLHHAVLVRKHDNVKWLLEQPECPILAVDDAGWSALHIASSIGDAESLGLLLSHDQARNLLNLKNEQGSTALHYACSKGHLDAVRMLLEAGTDFLVVNRWGQTALHRAATLGHAGVVRALLEGTPNRYLDGLMDAKDSEKLTALDMAIQEGHEEVVSNLKNKK